MLEGICIGISLLYFFILIASRIGFIKSVHRAKTDSNYTDIAGCTVIIPARNEENNILQCLYSILKTKTPFPFEIIVVNDFSEDKTGNLAKEFFSQYPIGKVIDLDKHLNAQEPIVAYKKKALEIAIREARYPWIVQTDADCTVSDGWLQALFFDIDERHTTYIAGPVKFIPHPKSRDQFLFALQAIDFMTMQAITAATHYFDIGSMSNGANLAFQKAVFERVNGYSGIDEVASGDDMLLIEKINQQYPKSGRYQAKQECIVHTHAQDSWGSFISQRVRWSSKNAKYQDHRLTLILAVVYLFNLQFLILTVASFFNTIYLYLGLGLLLAKLLVELFLVIPAAKFFNNQKVLWFFPILQPLHILYIISTGFLGVVGKYEWKGRRVH